MKKIKFILFILFASFFVELNVYACLIEDGCTNCPSNDAVKECQKNIKVAIYGDSVSTYEGYINGVDGDSKHMAYYSNQQMSMSETWWARVINSKGWRLLANDSIRNTRVTWDGTTNDNERIGQKYYMAGDYRTNSVGSKGVPDKILIFAGINDIYADEVSIGSVSSATSNNDSVFANAYNSMIKKLKSKYPNADIVCIIPYIPKYQTNSTVIRTNQIGDVITGIAKNNNLKYVDLRTINFANEDFLEGIHPSSSGMEKIASAVGRSIPLTTDNNDSSNNNTNNSSEKKENYKPEVNFDAGLDFCASTSRIWQVVGWAFLIVKIIVPLLLIIFGVKDLVQAVISGKDDEIKKSTKSLMIRAIASILIFFIPTIVSLVMGLIVDFSTSGAKADFLVCQTCILNPSKCDTSSDVGKQ